MTFGLFWEPIRFPVFGIRRTPSRRKAERGSKVVARRSRLQVPASVLFVLEGFEEGLEVALAEALASAAADDLEEEGRPVLQRFREELEEVALVVRVDQDSEIADAFVILLDRLVAVLGEDAVDPLPDGFVVGVGQ